MIICGLPGDDEHRKLFAEAVEKLRKALTGRCGFAASEILVRSGAVSRRATAPRWRGRRALDPRGDRLGRRRAAEAAHARRHALGDRPGARPLRRPAFAPEHPRPGPRRAGVRQAVRGAQGAGAGLLDHDLRERVLPQAAPGAGRIVITATEPDQEVNETLFPLSLADVLASPPEGIDRDKDGQISVLELYLAVVADVMKRYVDAEDLPTEHARLDDNGDGRGSEVQEDYLPPELGGRTGTGSGPAPERKPDADGALRGEGPRRGDSRPQVVSPEDPEPRSDAMSPTNPGRWSPRGRIPSARRIEIYRTVGEISKTSDSPRGFPMSTAATILALALLAQPPAPEDDPAARPAGHAGATLLEVYTAEAAGYTIYRDAIAQGEARAEARAGLRLEQPGPRRRPGRGRLRLDRPRAGRGHRHLLLVPRRSGPRDLCHEFHSLSLSVLDVSRSPGPTDGRPGPPASSSRRSPAPRRRPARPRNDSRRCRPWPANSRPGPRTKRRGSGSCACCPSPSTDTRAPIPTSPTARSSPSSPRPGPTPR